MGDAADLTIEILKQIRDELRSNRDELRATREEISARLDQANNRLDRVIQEQIRHATAIVSLEQGQRELFEGQGRVISELQRLNDRMDHFLTGPMGQSVRSTTSRVDDLELRVLALEQRVGR